MKTKTCLIAAASGLLLGGCAGIQYSDNAPAEDLRGAGSKSRTVTVLAKGEGWRSAGVKVEPGNDYEITATGRWSAGPLVCGYTGPDGVGAGGLAYQAVILQGESASTLIARIGESGQPFSVGGHYNLHGVQSGPLYFRSNDGIGMCGDNEGQMQVTTTLTSQTPAPAESQQPKARARTHAPAPAPRPKNSQSWR